MILSMICSKGGVGKTTTAVNLAAFLSLKKKKKVLMVDLDSQASLTRHAGIKSPLVPLEEIILNGRSPKKAIIKTVSGDLLPSSIGLAGIDIAIAEKDGCLNRVLKPLVKGYDYIVIDTPPSFSSLSVNAIALSDFVVIPVTPQYLSLEGLQQILDNWEAGNLLGILPTMIDRRKKITDEIMSLYRENLGEKMFKAEIRQNVKLEEAPSHGKSIFEYSPRSVGAKCYEDFGKEVLRRIKKWEN